MLRPSPGCKLEVLAGARRLVFGVTDRNLSLFTGLQGPKISRTDFSRNHSCLCSKYTRTVGYNKELLFSDLRSKFLLIVWIKAFLLFYFIFFYFHCWPTILQPRLERCMKHAFGKPMLSTHLSSLPYPHLNKNILDAMIIWSLIYLFIFISLKGNWFHLRLHHWTVWLDCLHIYGWSCFIMSSKFGF